MVGPEFQYSRSAKRNEESDFVELEKGEPGWTEMSTEVS